MTSKTSPNMLRLTDAQLIALSKAVQRDDRRVIPSPNVRGAAVLRFFGALLAKGLIEAAEQQNVGPDGPAAYIITAQGRAALGIEDADTNVGSRGQADASDGTKRNVSEEDSTNASGRPRARTTVRAIAQNGYKTAGEIEPDRPTPSVGQVPRASSKLAQVIAMLSLTDGAAISDIMTATGWLSHTTRAALTGLRKRGCCPL